MKSAAKGATGVRRHMLADRDLASLNQKCVKLSVTFLTLNAKQDSFHCMSDIRKSDLNSAQDIKREILCDSIDRHYERWKRSHFLSSCNRVNERKLIDHLSVVWIMDAWWTRSAERGGKMCYLAIWRLERLQTDRVMVTSDVCQERKQDVWLDIQSQVKEDKRNRK